MPKNSRRIGANFEREAAKLCQQYWHSSAYRTAQRTGLGGTADISDALPNGHVECKKRNSMAVYNFLDQANHDRSEDQYPVLLLRANHRPALVCFQIHDTDRFVQDYLSNLAACSGGSDPEREGGSPEPGDGG